jgi:Methyltransferase domain
MEILSPTRCGKRSVPIVTDLIFIDGDHRYEGVKRDFENYRGLLSDRGVILLHDVDPDHAFKGGEGNQGRRNHRQPGRDQDAGEPAHGWAAVNSPATTEPHPAFSPIFRHRPRGPPHDRTLPARPSLFRAYPPLAGSAGGGFFCVRNCPNPSPHKGNLLVLRLRTPNLRAQPSSHRSGQASAAADAGGTTASVTSSRGDDSWESTSRSCMRAWRAY